MDPIVKQTLEEHLGIFLFALAVSIIFTFVAWYYSYFKLPQKKEGEASSLHFGHLIGAFAIYFLISMAVSTLIYLTLSHATATQKQEMIQSINAIRGWVNAITMSVVFVALFIYLRSINQGARETVLGRGSYGGLTPKVKNFGMGMLTWVIVFPLVIAVSQLCSMILVLIQKQPSEQIAVRFLKSTMNNPVVFLVTIVFVVLIIPAIEEIIFRGFLQNYLAKFFGRIGGVIICSLIFAFFHFSMLQGWGNLEIVASLFAFSCFAGFVYFRQESLFASIGLHATFNGVNILLMSLASGVQQ